MSRTPIKSRRFVLPALVMSLTLVLAACSGDDPEPEETQTPQPSPTAPQDTEAEPEPEPGAPTTDEPDEEEEEAEEAQEADEAPPPPDVSAAGENIQSAAEAYLHERENQQSYHHEEPSGWLEEIEPLMTEDGFAEMADTIPEDGRVGDAWRVADENNLAVAVEVDECVVYEAAGVDEDDHKIIQCAMVDIVVDDDGDPVPVTNIPPLWPYVGPQSPAMLEVMEVDGDWLVHADLTGRAG